MAAKSIATPAAAAPLRIAADKADVDIASASELELELELALLLEEDFEFVD